MHAAFPSSPALLYLSEQQEWGGNKKGRHRMSPEGLTWSARPQDGRAGLRDEEQGLRDGQWGCGLRGCGDAGWTAGLRAAELRAAGMRDSRSGQHRAQGPRPRSGELGLVG